MSHRSTLFIWILALVVVDQATKAMAWVLPVGGPEWIQPMTNPATALGLVTADRLKIVLLTGGIGLMAARHLIRLVSRGLSPRTAALLLGGASSNFADRIVLGEVRDFLHVGGLVVNLADLFLIAGTFAWMRFILRTNGLGDGSPVPELSRVAPSPAGSNVAPVPFG